VTSVRRCCGETVRDVMAHTQRCQNKLTGAQASSLAMGAKARTEKSNRDGCAPVGFQSSPKARGQADHALEARARNLSGEKGAIRAGILPDTIASAISSPVIGASKIPLR
jgi:hypothetical protein